MSSAFKLLAVFILLNRIVSAQADVKLDADITGYLMPPINP